MLLIGVPFFSYAVLKRLGDTVEIDGPLVDLHSYSSGARSWNDEPRSSASYTISANREDANGNVIGQIEISFYREHIGDVQRREGLVDSVKYYADAWASGEAGRANAWVIAPGKGRAHDENPDGASEVSWFDPNLPSAMYASDTSIRSVDGVGNRSLQASASLSEGGAPRVSLKVTLEEIDDPE